MVLYRNGVGVCTLGSTSVGVSSMAAARVCVHRKNASAAPGLALGDAVETNNDSEI